MNVNLELKVRCTPGDLLVIRDKALLLGAESFEILEQIDTYFRTGRGRLKLRSIRSGQGKTTYEVIGYQRPDESAARWSHYSRTMVDEDQAETIARALESTLGIWRVVEKRRTVATWRRTRIHLDQVTGLGTFAELETVCEHTDELSAEEELRTVAIALGLDHLTIVAGSYADLGDA